MNSKILVASLAMVWIASLSAAEQLVPVGVLGNSGQETPYLIRVDPAVIGKSRSGVAVDRDRTLWAGAGTAVNRLTLGGARIETVRLSPAGSIVESQFAILDDHLYFFGKTPDKRPALFGVATKFGPRTANVVVANLPPVDAGRTHLLADQPLGGRLLMAIDKPGNYGPSTKTHDRRVAVYAWKPGSPGFVPLCEVPGFAPNGIAVDPIRRRIYIGGLLFPPPESPSINEVWAITAVNEKGEVAGKEFPAARGQSQYGPVQYMAHINAAGGALWDLAWYGYLARLAPNGSGDPGGVEKWHHELGGMAQIVDVGDVDGAPSGVLACATAANSALYIGHWQPQAKRIDWIRRIGCLPVITSLWLTPEGWVAAGTESCQAWWQFDDASDSPPRKCELHIAQTPTAQRGKECLGMAALYSLDDLKTHHPTPMAFTWEPTAINEARGLGEAIPLKTPAGLTVENPNLDGNGHLFVSDADGGKIWQTTIWRPGLNPDNKQWKPLAYANPAAEKQIVHPTDLAWLTDGTLLVAVSRGIVLLKPTDAGYVVAWRFDHWGAASDAHFGRRLRLSLFGNRLLVADTDRHRVLLFDFRTRSLLAQTGKTDEPGNDLQHLRFPTLTSLVSHRAVVADTGNQRIVKLVVKPSPVQSPTDANIHEPRQL